CSPVRFPDVLPPRNDSRPQGLIAYESQEVRINNRAALRPPGPIRAVTLSAVRSVDAGAPLRIARPRAISGGFLRAVRRERYVFELVRTPPPRFHLLDDQIDLGVGEVSPKLLTESRHGRRRHSLLDYPAQVIGANQAQVQRVI